MPSMILHPDRILSARSAALADKVRASKIATAYRVMGAPPRRIGTIFPRDYRPDETPSCNAGLARHTWEECSQVPSATKADAGAISVRSRDRSNVYGWNRTRQTKSKFAGDGSNCGCPARSVGETNQRVIFCAAS